jgi:hypothetical protein
MCALWRFLLNWKCFTLQGEVSERFKEHAWKACVGEILPWVRIPPSPPDCRTPCDAWYGAVQATCPHLLEVAGGGAALFQVSLMIFFGTIECPRRRDFCRDRTLKLST